MFSSQRVRDAWRELLSIDERLQAPMAKTMIESAAAFLKVKV